MKMYESRGGAVEHGRLGDNNGSQVVEFSRLRWNLDHAAGRDNYNKPVTEKEKWFRRPRRAAALERRFGSIGAGKEAGGIG